MTDICIFWDNSNIYVPAIDLAKEREGATVGGDLRIHFENLYELARAGRKIVAGSCVGSLPPDLHELWEKLAKTGVSLELFERGAASGHEQAVDQALQVHMLRARCDLEPGTAVLLTGDGAGQHEGRGYFADLQRMQKAGWKVEVLSWRSSCHGAMRAWVEENGRFVALDDFYDSITFVKGIRRQAKLPKQHR